MDLNFTLTGSKVLVRLSTRQQKHQSTVCVLILASKAGVILKVG